MRDRLLDFFVVKPVYVVQYILRLIFLSGRAGALLHNFIYCAWGKIFAIHYENKRKVDWIVATLTQGNRVAIEWQRRVYSQHPNCWKRLLKNLFIYRIMIGGIKRRRLKRKGIAVPSSLSISPNTPDTGCNLRCSHCIAFDYPKAELPFEVLNCIIREQEELGLYSVIIGGGEPFMYNRIWEIFKRYPKTTFMIFTNGTLLNQEMISRLILLGNAYPMFSLEGFQKETDAMRGEGVFNKAISAMKQCRDSGLPYAVTVMVTKDNFKAVISDLFLQMLVELECLFINYSTYVPIGSHPSQELVISLEQSQQLAELSYSIKDHYPIFPSIGLNGIGVGRCWAAREIFHITATGDVEPCPFVKWSAGNIKKNTIIEITNSQFFQGVRGLAKTGNPLLVPCQALRSQFLQKVFQKLGAHPTTKPTKEVEHNESKELIATRAS